MKTYWVYILECKDGSFYTGSTSNLEKRISEHNFGAIEGYTKSRRPVKLGFPNISKMFNMQYLQKGKSNNGLEQRN